MATSSGPMVTSDILLSVTGVLTPDSTGTFVEYGDYKGQRYYRRTDGSYFIWWNGVNKWSISVLLGVQGANWWEVTQAPVVGVYAPMGGAVGNATVAAI